jgi:hypothetical protein
MSAVVVVWIVLSGASVFAIVRSASSRERFRDDGAKLLGNWAGESICVGNHPACHDEQVVYRISKAPDESSKVTITADKIINGKPETMYVLDFKYDEKKGTLTGEFVNSRYHGVWEYTVKGDTMEGTLTLLPDKTIARRVRVRKEGER